MSTAQTTRHRWLCTAALVAAIAMTADVRADAPAIASGDSASADAAEGGETAEIAAIEQLLAAGRGDEALARAQGLVRRAAQAHVPPGREAAIQLALARALDHTEIQHEAVVAAADRVLALLGTEQADAPAAITARRLRGVAHARLRKPALALADLEEAVRSTRERGGADGIDYADALYDLSLAQRTAADYGGAITSLETALAIRRKVAPDDRVALARGLIRLGQTQRISGDLDRAEANYREALALDEASPDPSGRNGAVVLYALGNLHRNRNEADRAIAYYERAARAFEQAYGADSPMLAIVLNNYGNAESLRAGRGEAAVALFQRALDIAERTHSQDPGHYMPIANIAMVRIWQHRYVEAEAGFRRALERFGDAPAASETTPLFAQHGLAAALWGQGRHAEAFAAASSAEATRQAAVRAVAASLSDQQALAFQEQDYETLDHAIAIAIDSGDAGLVERAWSLAIGARGQLTAIQAGRLMQARASGDAKLRGLWQDWLEASSALERARIGAGVSVRSTAQARLERAERRLAIAVPQARELSTRVIGMAELRAAMPPGTALVWLHDLAHRKPDDFANAAVDVEDPETWAFVLPPGGRPIATIALGPASVITRELEQWLASMENPASGSDLLRQRGQALAARVWAPIAAKVAAQRIFVVAEGPLLHLPWPALPDGDGYLVERDVAFHLLNDERELLAPPVAPRARHALLAVADPNGATAGMARPANARCSAARALPALPGARREVARLERLFRDGDAATPMLSLLGDAASEARFRREAPRASLVHLATHGVAAAAGCDDGDGTRGVSLAAEPDAKATSPTALVLATPRDGSDDSTNDGLLGELEIAALDLSAVRWAVLAACSTAAGATHRYEGLYGLARAFRLGGARTVLLSRWPVDDEATAQWSEALYRARLRERADTPTAVQRAQRAVLAARRARGDSDHPWYWAGFFALGDWR